MHLPLADDRRSRPKDSKCRAIEFTILRLKKLRYDERLGAKKTTFQISDSLDGLRIGAFTGIGAVCVLSKAVYVAKREELADSVESFCERFPFLRVHPRGDYARRDGAPS